MPSRGAKVLGVGLAALFVALPSCGGAAGGSQPVCTTPPAGQAALSAQATARALTGTCPARGVWSVLVNLRITAYTSTGKLLLQGAESGPGGLFVYDFEIPTLARMASQPVGPFSSFAARLKALGLKQQPAALLATYKSAYQSHPSAFLPQLFTQMKLSFDGDPQLTALQQWLLVVDGLVPPPAASASAATLFSYVMDSWGLARIDITGIRVDPNDLSHMLVLSDRIDLSINPDFASAATGVKQPGDLVPISATVRLDPQPQITFGAPYGSDIVIIPQHFGPLEDVPVSWTLTGDLSTYGELQLPGGAVYGGAPTSTDPLGTARVAYQAGEDPGEGQGPKEAGVGMVVATADETVLGALLHSAYLLVGAYITAVSVFVPPAFAVVTISYHLAADYDAKIVITCPVPTRGSYTETFTGRFTPNPNLPEHWGGTFAVVVKAAGQSSPGPPTPLIMSIDSGGASQRLLIEASHLISPVEVPIAGGTGSATESNCPFGGGSVSANLTPVIP